MAYLRLHVLPMVFLLATAGLPQAFADSSEGAVKYATQLMEQMQFDKAATRQNEKIAYEVFGNDMVKLNPGKEEEVRKIVSEILLPPMHRRIPQIKSIYIDAIAKETPLSELKAAVESEPGPLSMMKAMPIFAAASETVEDEVAEKITNGLRDGYISAMRTMRNKGMRTPLNEYTVRRELHLNHRN